MRNPIDLACDYVQLGRRQGKTTAMIMSLPEDGKCTIILARHAMIRDFKNQINELRPEVQVENINFVADYDLRNHLWTESPQIRGRKIGPVYIDNAVIDNAILRLFDEANRWAKSYDG